MTKWEYKPGNARGDELATTSLIRSLDEHGLTKEIIWLDDYRNKDKKTSDVVSLLVTAANKAADLEAENDALKKKVSMFESIGSFSDGVNSMARNVIPALDLVRQGRWTLDQVEQWLKACINQDPDYLKKVSTEWDKLLKH